jgi:hypothetical protein
MEGLQVAVTQMTLEREQIMYYQAEFAV